MTAPVSNRPLSKEQIKMLIERCKDKFVSKFEQASKKRIKEALVQRKADLEKVLASVPKATRTDIVSKLMGQSHAPIAGVITPPEEFSIYSRNNPLKRYLEDLKFDLTMAGASGYEAVVKAFETKISKMVK